MSYGIAEVNSLTYISETSFKKEEIMGERICQFKTLVSIAKLLLKVVATVYTLLGDILNGFVSDIWDEVNCRLWEQHQLNFFYSDTFILCSPSSFNIS